MIAPRARLATGLGVALAAVLGALVPRPTGAELVSALSNHLVAITTGFSGTEALLFGTTGGAGDVVVVVRGPETAQVVRRKGRRLGIWLNEREVVFDRVPGFYAVAASRPLAEFLPARIAARHQIGTDTLDLVPRAPVAEAERRAFRDALIRNKQRLSLYGVGVGEVTLLGGSLFRSDMAIPANAPVGTYTVATYLIQDGEVAGAEVAPLIVSKVGFEAQLFDLAQRSAAAYGVLAITIAAVAGWLASLIFRKG